MARCRHLSIRILRDHSQRVVLNSSLSERIRQIQIRDYGNLIVTTSHLALGLTTAQTHQMAGLRSCPVDQAKCQSEVDTVCSTIACLPTCLAIPALIHHSKEIFSSYLTSLDQRVSLAQATFHGFKLR